MWKELRGLFEGTAPLPGDNEKNHENRIACNPASIRTGYHPNTSRER